MPQNIVIEHTRAAGDIVVLTGAVRDLVAANPGEFNVRVKTSCSTLWHNNPHVQFLTNDPPPGIKGVRANYGQFIKAADNTRLHFSQAFHKNLEEQLQVPCPVLKQHGDLYLDDWHKENPPVAGRYWYIITGGKSDFPAKVWSARSWQQSVNILKEFNISCVQDGALYRGHVQPPMQNVVSTVGRTNLRDMMWLIYHAEGVICHVTCAMHMAAALGKPCVVVAGGREHWWWEAYVNVAIEEQFGAKCAAIRTPHRFLHTQDLLDCCTGRGCWKNKVVKRNNEGPHVLCKRPGKDVFGQDVPECLLMIKPEHVVEAVMSYYEDGTLPPIGEPKQLVKTDGTPINPDFLAPKHTTLSMAKQSPGFIDLFAPAKTPIIKDPGKDTALEEVTVLHKFEKETAKTNEEQAFPDDVYDNDVINGRVAVCVLLYGEYFDLHRKCINSILSTVPPKRMQLRVAGNALNEQSLDYLENLKRENLVHKTYINDTNIKKYPAMRQMFYDMEDPITDKYVMWFDDDSIADKDTQWFTKLCSVIKKNHAENYRYYGAKFFWNFNHEQIEWIKSRPWYRNRSFQMKNGLESPNASKVMFATGGFWAAEMAAIRGAGVPDAQIGHNGGDYMIGEQLWQYGVDLKEWNRDKMFVTTSSVPRRGLNEVHTGQNGWVPGGVTK